MSPFLLMKSIKKVKPLEEIVMPYVIETDRVLEGNINGAGFYVAPGVPTELTYPQYETLFYAGQLED